MIFYINFFSNKQFSSANHSVSLLIEWLGSHISPVSLKSCLDFLNTQIELDYYLEYPILVTILQVMTCLIEQNASQLTVETMQRWIQLTQWVLESTRRQDLLSRVARLLRSMIKVKNIPLLIEVYRYLLFCRYLIACILW